MTRGMDKQRAVRRVNRRAWATIPDDDFLIAAVHLLFLRIEGAQAAGVAQITPQGKAFLAELSKIVLRYLGPSEHDLEKGIATACQHGVSNGATSPRTRDWTECEAPYPEGGLEAWLVVLGSWCGLLSSIGMTNVMGSFQTYISENQLRDYSEGIIGWIFSLYAFLAFFCGIYVGPIFDKYGPRWLLLTGSICVVASMMLLGLCTSYWHFLLVFGGLGGIGTALIFTPCVAAIGHYFKAGRGNATGIAVSSGALGGIFFPLMLRELIPSIGFAWSTRIIGCIYLALCATANLLVNSRLPPIKAASAKPDFQIFRDAAFSLTVAGVFLLEWGLFVPLTYISSYAAAQGFSVSLSYEALIFLNVGSVFGRILPGYIADRIGRYNTNISVIVLAIVSIFCLWLSPAGRTNAGLIAFSLLFGFASGSNISLAPVCLGELCRTEEYGRYYATCFTIVSFGCLTGIPIAGNITARANGSYWGLIIFTGTCYVGGLLAFMAARVLATGWRFKIKY